jgi:hypothetical protein
VTATLDEQVIDALFDPARFLRNLDVVFDRLAKLPVSEEA